MTAADPHAPPGRRSRRGGTLGPVSLALTRHHAVVNVMTVYDVPDDFETSQVELDLAERGLGALIEACERAAEEIGAVIPQAPLRALMVIDRAGSLNLSQLAAAVSASAAVPTASNLNLNAQTNQAN